MIQRARNLLCPIEFDDSFSSCLELAKMLVDHNQGKLYLMHVVAPTSDLLVSGGLRTDHDLATSEIKLRQIAQEKLAGIPHAEVLRVGDPAEEILKAEREFGIDLVVMPTHRHGEVSRLLLESVTRRVVSESICPVTTLSEKAWNRVRRTSPAA
jgi:glycine betaine transporter